MNSEMDSTAAIHGQAFRGPTFRSSFHGMHAHETC
jgi:hypothetical protein